ncbi:MAG: putative molybdenum carrier protein [Tatlockia sp.]|nr:putative molybdenum carrier protein [Tatlockia sp.]
MIRKIITGGQTGVDQAALSAATESGIDVGGWCPKNGADENNINILELYPALKESHSKNPNLRTKLNIRDSDGTLIIVPSWPLPEALKDGTQLTFVLAKQLKKPHLIINLTKKTQANAQISSWIEDNNISKLNIAGPRESNCPGINSETYQLLLDLFRHMNL